MNWHPFAERFPLLEGEEYEALKASIKSTNGIDEQPILFRVVDNKIEGLDGRNRERACRELRIKPKMKKVSVTDGEVKDFILRRNVHRRHMTKELRQAIVAELRADGQSTRSIAGTLGVSDFTVRKDLEVAGARNIAPEQIVGKDGKSYSPVPPTPSGQTKYCRPCRTRGPRPNCPDCEAMNKPREPGDDTDQERKRQPANGRVAWDRKEFDQAFGALLREIDKFGRCHDVKDSPAAENLRDQLTKFREGFLTWTKGVQAAAHQAR